MLISVGLQVVAAVAGLPHGCGGECCCIVLLVLPMGYGKATSAIFKISAF